MKTLPRCTFTGRRGQRCDRQQGHDDAHAFGLWPIHGGRDPDKFYLPEEDHNERTAMAKQQIEKPSPEETAPDEETTEASGPKYQKYPNDPAQWTPEHDLKLFGDVAKLMSRAPYIAHCRMFPYLQGLISPDHAAERARIDQQFSQAKDMAVNAIGGPYIEGAVRTPNVGIERRY